LPVAGLPYPNPAGRPRRVGRRPCRGNVGEAGIVGPAIGGKATPLAAAVSDIEPRFRMRRPAATQAYVRPNYASRADPDSAAFVISLGREFRWATCR